MYLIGSSSVYALYLELDRVNQAAGDPSDALRERVQTEISPVFLTRSTRRTPDWIC